LKNFVSHPLWYDPFGPLAVELINNLGIFGVAVIGLASMPYRNSIRHFGCKTMMDKLLLGKICLVQI